jgi:sulfite exporter TauE/SafE
MKGGFRKIGYATAPAPPARHSPSRPAQWAVRTVTAPILASVGVVTYQVLGRFTGQLGEVGVSTLRYVVLGILGALFLYYGLKAVHLTEMANRVWKRAAEYNLIVAERQRLGRTLS